MEDVHAILRQHTDKIRDSFRTHADDVVSLQSTLIENILPDVVDELELNEELTSWAKEWLSDTSTVFQLLRRNSFTRSFALEATRKALVWRIQNVTPQTDEPPSPIIRSVSDDTHDRDEHPILVLEASVIESARSTLRDRIIAQFEWMRVHLQRLNGREDREPDKPVLQYVVVLDVKSLSVRNVSIELLTWMANEVIPRFPGMLAAVIVVNYSWAHSGLWSIAKRLLPKSALSRIIFLTRDELSVQFGRLMLPSDDVSLQSPSPEHPSENAVEDDESRITNDVGNSPSTSSSRPQPVPIQSRPSRTMLSSTSLLNPFFGYPVSSPSSSHIRSRTTSSYHHHALHHGRRRKRDLAKTLAVLLWIRWRTYFKVCFWLALTVVGVRVWGRKWGSRPLIRLLGMIGIGR